MCWRDVQEAGEMLLSNGLGDDQESPSACQLECPHNASYYLEDDRDCGCVWMVCNDCGDTAKSHSCDDHPAG